MKKNTILYIIIAILLIISAVGITYIIIDNNNEEVIEPNNNNDKEEEKNDNEEQITLSNKELEEYLSYVPRDVINENNNMYINPKSSNELSNQILLGATLNYADNYTSLRIKTEYEDTFLFSKTEINKLMKKLYNKELVSLETEIEYSCNIYSNYDTSNYMQSGGCGINFEHINSIKEYDIVNNDLIIYEYAAYLELGGENETAKLIDYQTKKEEPLLDDCLIEDSCNSKIEDFTLYKHTFKKNDTGYYWYSTEVA